MDVKEFIKKHPRIYERVVECYREQVNPLRSTTEGPHSIFVNGFRWADTREEHTFWQYIKNGNFDVFYEKYPETSSELTSLPEKWCIKVTPQNKETLGKWRTDGSLSGGGYIYHKGYYGVRPNIQGYWLPGKKSDCTEITFEQFKKWVLNESSMEEKWVPKVGEYFYCHTDLIMESSGKKEATNGNIYPIEKEGCFTNNSGNKSHVVGNYSKWFRKALPHEISAEEVGDRPESLTEKINRIFIEKGFDQIKAGDKYVDTDGDTSTASRDAEKHDAYIDCGAGYLWNLYVPDKFGYKVEKVSSTISPITSSNTKWSPGTFVLMLENNVDCSKYKKGEIEEIKSCTSTTINYVAGNTNLISNEEKNLIKWFATKSEAEQYWKRIQLGDSITESISYDDLLEQAIRNYPIGTKYIGISAEGEIMNRRGKHEIVRTPNWHAKKSRRDSYDGIEAGEWLIYYNGKWAEIISEHKTEPIIKSSDDAILEEAIRRYPIGTIYNSLDIHGILYEYNQKAKYKAKWVTGGPHEKLIDVGRGYVYANGKWANIVSLPIEESMLSEKPKTILDQLIEKAKREYPVGTKFIAPDDGRTYIVEYDIETGMFGKTQMMSIAEAMRQYPSLPTYFTGVDPAQETKRKSNTTQLKMLPVKKIKVRNNQNN